MHRKINVSNYLVVKLRYLVKVMMVIKKYFIHRETRIGIHGKPEKCVNADGEGCEGIGSSVHCDIYKNMGEALKNFVEVKEVVFQVKNAVIIYYIFFLNTSIKWL